MMDIKEKLMQNAALVERALEEYTSHTDEDFGIIIEAERYSLLGGGKRIRPFLVNEVCSLLGGSIKASMPLAAALEMIHSYSLIHDDLPCMDDDDLRRGKPTNHKVFGYANAVLAGDALLTRAFLTVASADALTDAQRTRAVRLLSEAAGDCGMIGGQVMDLAGEKDQLSLEKLKKLHSLKTGALIRCAVSLGCVAAGVDEDSEVAVSLDGYAKNIGLAFQMLDDVLDATQTAEALGKSVRSDAERGKTTFLSFYSAEEVLALASELTDTAIEKIEDIEGSEVLTDLAKYLLNRRK